MRKSSTSSPRLNRVGRPLIEILEGRILLSSSQLDPNFGTGGEVQANVGAKADFVPGVATDASGRIIVAAETTTGVAVLRYLPTGAPDPQFGSGGKTSVAIANSFVRAMAMQTDGKILVSGTNGSKAFLLRLNPNGKLDTTFAGGEIFFSIGVSNSADGVGETSSGKIYVTTEGVLPDNAPTFVLERFNVDGTKDTAFGAGGIATTAVGQYPSVNGLTVESNGKIVVAANIGNPGGSGPDIAVFNPNGTQYVQFGEQYDNALGGESESAIAVQSDGKVIDVGQKGTSGAYYMERFTAAGDPDPSFGNGGAVSTSFGANANAAANNVIVLPNGKVVVVGRANGNVEVVRYNGNGTLDATFGTGGEVSTAFAGKGSSAQATVYQSSGRIVVGAILNNSSLGLVRYLGDHVLLASGQSAVTTGASLAVDHRLDGSTIASQTLNFSFGSGSTAAHGQLVEKVIKETSGGTLDFYYQIINSSGSFAAIYSLVATNFAGFTTYVDYRPDQAGMIAPVTASRTFDNKSITFNFLKAPLGSGTVTPGKSSFLLYVKTNATHSNSSGEVLLNNTASLRGYEPTV